MFAAVFKCVHDLWYERHTRRPKNDSSLENHAVAYWHGLDGESR